MDKKEQTKSSKQSSDTQCTRKKTSSEGEPVMGGGEGYITFGVGVRLLGALFCSFMTEDATGSSEPSDSFAFES
jgi:hypothetical protein